jgi:YHS domain-containing protein
MAYLVLIVFAFWIARSIFRGIAAQLGRKAGSQPEELVRDAFCRTYIPKRSALKKRIAGADHYFCSRDCLKRFLQRNIRPS